MKKSLVVGVTWLFFAINFLSVSVTANFVSEKIGEQTGNNPLSTHQEDLFQICTHGPYMPLLNVATITLNEGDPEQIEKIEHILDNRILQFIIVSPFYQGVEVTNLNFSICYNRDIPYPNTLFFYRFCYHTWIKSDGNESRCGNIKHCIVVNGFTGEFELGRWIFAPPIFSFTGTCEQATIII